MNTQATTGGDAKRQVSLRLPESLVEEISRFGDTHGLATQTETFTELLQIGLAATRKPTPPAISDASDAVVGGVQIAAVLTALEEIKEAVRGIQRDRAAEHEELVTRFDVVSTAQVFAAYEAASAVEYCVRFLAAAKGQTLNLQELQTTFSNLGKQRALKWLLDNGAIEPVGASDADGG